MFELPRLIGQRPRSIVLQTSKATNVENCQELPAGPAEVAAYARLKKRFGANWIEREPARGLYNCAGHVWASRRTSILDDVEWRKVLLDDGFRRIGDAELRVGDLALYLNAADGNFLHVAEVTELRSVQEGRPGCIPWALSKFNSTSGEVFHNVNDVSYAAQGIPFRVEFWTERSRADAA